MSELIPNPPPRPVSILDAEFWDHCANGVLAFQRCSDCGTWRHIPRFMCASCLYCLKLMDFFFAGSSAGMIASTYVNIYT